MGYPVEILVQPIFLGEKGGFQFCVRPRAVKGYAAGLGSVHKFLLIGPYELADPILLEMSLIGTDAVWGLQQVSIRKL